MYFALTLDLIEQLKQESSHIRAIQVLRHIIKPTGFLPSPSICRDIIIAVRKDKYITDYDTAYVYLKRVVT